MAVSEYDAQSRIFKKKTTGGVFLKDLKNKSSNACVYRNQIKSIDKINYLNIHCKLIDSKFYVAVTHFEWKGMGGDIFERFLNRNVILG